MQRFSWEGPWPPTAWNKTLLTDTRVPAPGLFNLSETVYAGAGKGIVLFRRLACVLSGKLYGGFRHKLHGVFQGFFRNMFQV